MVGSHLTMADSCFLLAFVVTPPSIFKALSPDLCMAFSLEPFSSLPQKSLPLGGLS